MKTRTILLVTMACLICLEVIGRYYGLHNYPLFVENDAFEYIHAPNQSRLIYRNKFATNEYSMRSRPVNPETDTSVVLLIGDSIINGGNPTDQDSLASTILEHRLSTEMGRNIRVLNISSPSWGPDNAAAYIRQYGTFHAKMMILVCNSGDAFDNMTFEPTVGHHPQYPKEQAFLALSKLAQRGFQKMNELLIRFVVRGGKDEKRGPAVIQEFNKGFRYFSDFSRQHGIPLVILHHISMDELVNSRLSFEGELIRQFCTDHSIPYLNEMEFGVKASSYGDDLHYNHSGQKYLANILFPVIIKQFNNSI